MGQRSQLYIRYKNKKNLVAMHLQWNYGYYMINRTYQLLDFIGKNVKADYSNFKEENFDIVNNNNRREDIAMLQNLIQMNTTIGSYVGGADLIKEDYEWGTKEEDLKETFKMNPLNQDNNNGILVIDIQENGKVKYGLSGGYEEVDNFEDFKMIKAEEYFRLSEKDYSDEKYKLENRDKELYDEVLKQIEFIDSNFELLTDEEYKEIFDTEYKWEDCIRPKDLEDLSTKKKMEQYINNYINSYLENDDELTKRNENKYRAIQSNGYIMNKLVTKLSKMGLTDMQMINFEIQKMLDEETYYE